MKRLLFLGITGFGVGCAVAWMMPEAWGDTVRAVHGLLAAAFYIWRMGEFLATDDPGPYADEDYCPRKYRSPFRD